MHGSPSVVFGFQQSFVDEAVAMPFVLFRLYFGQADGFLHQRAEYAGLGQGLSVHLSYPGCRSVGGDDHQRYLAVIGLGHGGMQVQQGRAGGAADGSGPVVVQGKSQGEESGTAFVRHGIAGE